MDAIIKSQGDKQMKKVLSVLVLFASLITPSFSLLATTMDFVFYDKVGETGHQKVTFDGNRIISEKYMKWNNRVVDLKEELKLSDDGDLRYFNVKGVSAFGSPVDESFSWKEGHAVWKSSNESGQTNNNGKKFYLPLNSAGGLRNAIMQKFMTAKKAKIDLLPSGSLSIKQVAETTLQQDGKTVQVFLFATTGGGFTPQYSWFDKKGFSFADYSPWMSKLRQGWDPAY